MARRSTIRAGSHEAWTVFALLLLAVIVPTACVLWFMSHAMRNEQLATRQTLTEAYRSQLVALQAQLEAHWTRRIAALEQADLRADPRVTFAAWVRSGTCHAAILLDEAGRPRYPEAQQHPTEVAATNDPLAGIADQEWEDPSAAAAAYARIAGTSGDVDLAARALVAQARCLVRQGQVDPAVQLLLGPLSDARYARAVDRNERWIVPSGRLLALQWLDNPAREAFRETAALLHRQLEDYTLAIPAGQRRFLMEQFNDLVPEAPTFTTLEAERLAARYFEAAAEPSALTSGLMLPFGFPQVAGAAQSAQLAPGPVAGLWQLGLKDHRATALYDEQRLRRELQSLSAYPALTAATKVELVPPTAPLAPGGPFLDIAAGPRLPQWRVAMFLDNSDPFKLAAARMTTIYLWTGILVVVVIALLALLAARYVTRQMRLTRLKNDLIATVSHELRTPLSSIRLLVDTLLDNHCHDPRQTLDYLGLIANENNRLCRLVDNFLTFSRMERNKRVFTFTTVSAAEIAQAAAASVKERFAAGDCRLEVLIEPEAPAIIADRDAMITVLLNLLDNACKYSDAPRHIVLRVGAADGQVFFAVKDNGIGMSRRTLRRIFDRFYQVDQTLSRKAGGCGLGLSIVRFIAEAHHGSIDVESQPGKGSTFTVRIAAADRPDGRVREVANHAD